MQPYPTELPHIIERKILFAPWKGQYGGMCVWAWQEPLGELQPLQWAHSDLQYFLDGKFSLIPLTH